MEGYLRFASRAGIRQMVNVSPGLDSRAYRLLWPDAIVICEIDKPEVIEFKRSVLTHLGAVPKTELHTVGADLGLDWMAAQCAAGFNPRLPTAWIPKA